MNDPNELDVLSPEVRAHAAAFFDVVRCRVKDAEDGRVILRAALAFAFAVASDLSTTAIKLAVDQTIERLRK